MKTLKHNIYAFAALTAMATSCTDMDIEPDSSYITDGARTQAVASMGDRGEAEIMGAFAKAWLPGASEGATAYNGYAYPDDGGYPTVCFMFDLGAADVTAPAAGYNWFSTSSEWADRNAAYRNPRIRWRVFYGLIKAANDIIAGRDVETASGSDLVACGQGLALRAFGYLNLAPYYAFKYKGHESDPCVPLITEQNMGDDSFERASVKAVYDQIVSDLTQAINCLEGYERNMANFIDRGVAYGLRARAYLAMEEWEKAASDAEAALSSENLSASDGRPYSIDEVGRPGFCNIDDHSWMWGIKLTDAMVDGEYASWPSWLGSFSTNGYAPATGVYAMINKILFEQIPSTDVRKGWWVDENLHSDCLTGFSWLTYSGDNIAKVNVSDVKVPFLPYTNVKFGFQSGADLSKNGGDWPIMRVEEMLLIQAEAYYKAGQQAKGQQILEDFVKTNRDPSYSVSASGLPFEDELWKQRRIELWGEGFAYSDLMRLNKNMVRFRDGEQETTNVPTDFQFNIKAGDRRLLLIIPQSEINANTKITQNDTAAPKSGEGVGITDGVTD